jgi:exodeoxyribonuclease VII small subunit
VSDETDGIATSATFEQARDALADVVGRLEAGGLTLEESVTLWERGERLARECEAFLAAARTRVEGPAPQDGE